MNFFFVIASFLILQVLNAQRPHYPGEHDYIAVDVELVQLLNPQGLQADGQKCDNNNDCDPKIFVYLDTDLPLMAYPGGKAESDYQALTSFTNQNSPVINKNVSKNICGGSINKVNLRVHVVDEDVFSSKLIENFDCIFVADYDEVYPSAREAQWSATQDCRPQKQNNKVRLQFRHRLFDIPATNCGIKTSSGTLVRQ